MPTTILLFSLIFFLAVTFWSAKAYIIIGANIIQLKKDIMKRILVILFISIFTFSACRKDTLEIEEIGNSNNQEFFLEGTISGLVLDSNGEGLASVDIQIEGKTTTTDNNGYFKFNKLPGSDNGSLITFKKDGYFNSYKFSYTALNEDAYVKVKMIPAAETFRFQSNVGGQSIIRDGASIKIPSNAIVSSDGTSYTGEVVVRAHWFSPTELEIIETMPGDLRAINLDNELVQLATYGMMSVELESSNGESLQLGNNQKSELIFPLANEILSKAPQIIPLWHFDESSGIWMEEGSAKLSNGSYVGEVSHFSFWNCDVPSEVVGINGVLADSNGDPISNYNVSIFVNGTNISGYGTTNSQGKFEGKVPKDVPLTLKVFYCGDVMLNESLGTLTSDKDLGTFNVSFNDFGKQITAKLVDCGNMPLIDGYAIVKNTNNYELLLPNSEGIVSGFVSGCGSPEIVFFARDPLTLTDAPEIVITADNNDEDLGVISVCNSLEEYLTYTIDGGVTNLLENADVYLVNENLIYINARDPGINTFFEFQVGLTDIGTEIVDAIDVYGYNQDNNLEYLLCRPGVGDGCSFEISFENKPEQGVFLVGSGIGEITNDTLVNSDGFMVDADFRLNVDKRFNTGSISGQVWVDINGNAIKDSNELGIPGLWFQAIRVDGENYTRFTENKYAGLTDNDGVYVIDGLEPGIEYYIRHYRANSHLPVEANIGSDDTVDSDFVEEQNSKFYLTDVIIFNEGEIVENVDLGIELYALSMSATSSGCEPSARLDVNVNGGALPITVSLDNGLSTSTKVSGSYRFENLSSGTYEITATDRFGSTKTITYEVLAYHNSFLPFVWKDTDGDNIFSPQEDGLAGVRLEIWNLNEKIFEANTNSSNYSVSLSNTEPGMYKVVVSGIPTGYELVQMSVGPEETDSDIDPITNESDYFEIGACNSNIEIGIGFRKI